MFALMGQVQEGRPAAFTPELPGCIGASFYFGFNHLPLGASAFYLSRKERLKQDSGLAAAFYRQVQPVAARSDCLIFQKLEAVDDETEVEVINLWVDADALASLHALANYDRASNDNVIMPFASGCQSIWTLPCKENDSDEPRAVAGSLDPTVRGFLPPGAISFSVPAERFVAICDNIEDSFLGR